MKLGLFASAFDPFPHCGHLFAMEQAVNAGTCEAIVAALHVDPSVERPAKRRPVLTPGERYRLLKAIRWVDRVEQYENEQGLRNLIAWLRPAVLIVGEDHRDDTITGGDLGIPIYWAKRMAGWSGTEFWQRIFKNAVDTQV